MDRYAIFVDAGYFFSAGSSAAFGQNVPRHDIVMKSPKEMLEALSEKASSIADDLPILRIYWYDAAASRITLEQSLLASLPGLKLRLGTLNNFGQQKGVDSLLVTDLIELARNRAIASAIIIAGDDDLRIAFEVAQAFGVKVHILAAGDSTKNVSKSLRMESDSISTLDAGWFRSHLEQKKFQATSPTSLGYLVTKTATKQKSDFKGVAQSVVDAMLGVMDKSEIAKLRTYFETQTIVPPEHDRPLIARVSQGLSGQQFSGNEMRTIRAVFVTAIKKYQSPSK